MYLLLAQVFSAAPCDWCATGFSLELSFGCLHEYVWVSVLISFRWVIVLIFLFPVSRRHFMRWCSLFAWGVVSLPGLSSCLLFLALFNKSVSVIILLKAIKDLLLVYGIIPTFLKLHVTWFVLI